MRKKNIQLIAEYLLLLGCCLAGPVAADAQLHSHQDIIKQVKMALAEHIKAGGHNQFQIRPGNLDPRLSLQKCDIPLETYVLQSNQQSRGVTVMVKCNGHKPWKIYVPSQIYVYQQVLVATQAIARGQVIQAKDLKLSQHEISNLSYGYFVNKPDIVGKQATRTIFPGNVIRPQLLQDPILIKRGETVTIVAEVSGIKVSMTGQALTSGSKGKTIKVRNLSSKKIVDATIVDKGLVQVAL